MLLFFHLDCLCRLVAGFLILSPELCFVVEDETGIVGYACAALNAKQFYTQLESSWLPVMCTKYPLNDASSPPPNKHVEVREVYKSTL